MAHSNKTVKTEQQLRQEIDEWKEHIERFKSGFILSRGLLSTLRTRVTINNRQ